METSSLVASVVAAVVALASATSGIVQPTAAELLAAARAEFGDGILYPDPIVDAPFSAEAVTLWRPPANSGLPEWRATARYYRDRRGRVRAEQVYVGHAAGAEPQRVIVIPDPNDPGGYLLDARARTASPISRGMAISTVGAANSIVLPVAIDRFVDFPQPQRHTVHGRAVHEEEALGRRDVAGVHAVGTRLTVSWLLGVTAREVRTKQEQWMSPELKVMVASHTEDSLIGTLEYRLVNVSRAEPPAALFNVPPEYRETQLSFPQKWENPYVLVQHHAGQH